MQSTQACSDTKGTDWSVLQVMCLLLQQWTGRGKGAFALLASQLTKSVTLGSMRDLLGE